MANTAVASRLVASNGTLLALRSSTLSASQNNMNLKTTSLFSTLPTTAATTTTVSTTTVRFEDLPGTLMDFHARSVSDWDHVFDGTKLTYRAHSTWNALNVARVSLCAWVLLSHLAVITFVLGKRNLRVNPKNSLIANLAVSNIFFGIFVVPVKQHFILNPNQVQCQLEVGWAFITDYFQPCLTLFAVLSLVIERFVYVYTQKNQKKVLKVALILMTLALIAMPWLMSLLVLLPTYLTAFVAESSQTATCIFKVKEDYFLAAQILSFLLPSVCVFILAPYTGLLDCLRPSHCVYEYLTPKGESMAVTALISLISIFCEAPYCVIRIMLMKMECTNPYCSRLTQALNIAMWIRLSKAAIFPFVWLCYTDIRKAMLCHWPSSKRDSDDYFDDDDREHFVPADGEAGVAMIEASGDITMSSTQVKEQNLPTTSYSGASYS